MHHHHSAECCNQLDIGSNDWMYRCNYINESILLLLLSLFMIEYPVHTISALHKNRKLYQRVIFQAGNGYDGPENNKKKTTSRFVHTTVKVCHWFKFVVFICIKKPIWDILKHLKHYSCIHRFIIHEATKELSRYPIQSKCI